MLPTLKAGRSGYFVQQNRGKKSLCLAWQHPEALEILRALAAKVDIVVENYGPGVLQKRGLDYETLKKLNPRVIMACAYDTRIPHADIIRFAKPGSPLRTLVKR